ncbi:MAG: tetratricopeptide repeat-containing protein [Acidimicrobiales bacterium]
MAMGSDFLTDLRHRWDEQFGERRPFELWAVAGDRDVFVPASTSLGPFPPEAQVVIPGNHLEICMVRDPEDLTLRVLVDAVAGTDTPGGPLNAARVAVERRDFHRAIDLLAPHAGDLDDRHLVELALALDETGDREAAIEVLRAHATGTDARGTLAGRLKRAWLADGTRREAEEALELYREAYQEAVQRADHAQAAYLGINVAFLELAYVGDRAAAATTAEDVLTHCAEDHDDRWRAATEAEAHLYLGDRAEALACYRRAAAGATSARALTSTFQQAAWVASELDDDRLADELAALYHGVGEPDPGPRPAAPAHRPGPLG